MKTFYFPPYDGGALDYTDLVNKLIEEVEEAERAMHNYEDSNYEDKMRLNMLEELADVIHCAETIMRYYGVDYKELGDVIEFVTLKNRLRGYYEKDTRSTTAKNSVQS